MQTNIEDLNKREEESRLKIKNLGEKNTLLSTFKRVTANS